MRPVHTSLEMYAVLGALFVAVALLPADRNEARPPIGGGEPVAKKIAPAMERPALGVAEHVRIVNVIDGDTIEVEVVRRARVRLLDCWAPESRTTDLAEKKLGLAAKERLAELAAGKTATLFVPTGAAALVGDVTTLGRFLGHVWLDGDDRTLSAHQVEAGLAATTKGGRLGQ